MNSIRQAGISHISKGLRLLHGGVAFLAALALGVALTSPAALAADASAKEGGSVVFKIDPPWTFGSPYRWEYKTANGTATAGRDYTSTSGTVTFDDGSSPWAKYVSVNTSEDCDEETTEDFRVNFSNFQIQTSEGWVTPTWQIAGSDYTQTFRRTGEIEDGPKPPSCRGL